MAQRVDLQVRLHAPVTFRHRRRSSNPREEGLAQPRKRVTSQAPQRQHVRVAKTADFVVTGALRPGSPEQAAPDPRSRRVARDPARAIGPASAKRFDVFLSHRYGDQAPVRALKQHIERDLGYSVYVDWIESPELDRSKVDQATAEALRVTMRQCSCLVFYAGRKARSSRWMPWELGFFDGRHGSRRIAVYCPTEQRALPAQQEYLRLYQRIDERSLAGFLAWATDDTAAVTSATNDQIMRHLQRMTQHPWDYWLSVMQWTYGTAANLLLDPGRAVVSGDGQPSGPVREPIALNEPIFDTLRGMQDRLAELRRDLTARGRQSESSKEPSTPQVLAEFLQQWTKLFPHGDGSSRDIAVTAVKSSAPKLARNFNVTG